MSWDDLVASIDLSRLPFGIRMRVRDGLGPHPVLIVQAWVPERDGGTRACPYFGLEMPFMLSATPNAKEVRDAILNVLEHELDETFLVDGVRQRRPKR